jgi:hypothetical protein
MLGLTEIMKKSVLALLLFLVCMLTSCVFDSSTEELTQGYELAWIDFKENQAIYKGEEQVPGYVTSVGYNSDYIIAKQHPQKGGFYSEPVYSITNYFIIDIKENEKGDKQGVIGPLSKEQFDSKMEELEIKDKVKFTIEK